MSTRDAATLLTAPEMYPTRTHKLKTVMEVQNLIAYLQKKKVEKTHMTTIMMHTHSRLVKSLVMDIKRIWIIKTVAVGYSNQWIPFLALLAIVFSKFLEKAGSCKTGN